MPLFKIAASKHEPRRGIHYVMRRDKALTVSTLNLFGETEDEYVKQFQGIVDYFQKDNGPDARKYYHCKLSPDPKDNISPESLMDFARDMAEKYFSDFQCVIAVHKDTKTLHAHIIVNATGLKGKKVQIMKGDYAPMKDMANEIGKNYGLSPLDFRKKPLKKISSAERQQIERLGMSPKMQIRDAVDHAKELAYTESDFITLVEERNIQVKRVGKDYSFQHPEMKKAVRGATLGALYTRDYVTEFISKKNSNVALENMPEAALENTPEAAVGRSSEFDIDNQNYYGDISIGDDYVLDEDIDTLFEKDMKKGNLRYGAGYDELYDRYNEFLEDYRKQPDYIPDCLTPTGISQSYIEQGKVFDAYDLYLDQKFYYQNRLITERFEKEVEDKQRQWKRERRERQRELERNSGEKKQQSSDEEKGRDGEQYMTADDLSREVEKMTREIHEKAEETRMEIQKGIRESHEKSEEMRKEIRAKTAEMDRQIEERRKKSEEQSSPYNENFDEENLGDLESIFGRPEREDVPKNDSAKTKSTSRDDDYDYKFLSR